jgi:peptidoglycan/LPS O-acetylase OafA/YrhL
LERIRIYWILRAGGVLAFALFIYLVTAVEFTDEWLYRGGLTVIAALAAWVIAVSATAPPRALSVALRWFPLRWFGRISYGLYLWHWLVIQTTSLYFFGFWEPWAKLTLAVGIAAASYYLVEVRFNRLKTRFTSRQPLPASLPASADVAVPSFTVSTAN